MDYNKTFSDDMDNAIRKCRGGAEALLHASCSGIEASSDFLELISRIQYEVADALGAAMAYAEFEALLSTDEGIES